MSRTIGRCEHISQGSEIQTLDGFLTVEGGNEYLVDVTEWLLDKDGGEHEGRSLKMTLDEIAAEMKKVDGKNHRVIYDEHEDENFQDAMLTGFVFYHGLHDYEAWSVQLSDEDQKAVMEILSKYQDTGVSTRNAYDMSIYQCF